MAHRPNNTCFHIVIHCLVGFFLFADLNRKHSLDAMLAVGPDEEDVKGDDKWNADEHTHQILAEDLVSDDEHSKLAHIRLRKLVRLVGEGGEAIVDSRPDFLAEADPLAVGLDLLCHLGDFLLRLELFDELGWQVGLSDEDRIR